MNPRLQNKIYQNVRKQDGSECWQWVGQISNSGYGKIMVKLADEQPETLSADHVSYLAFVGDIPEGMLTRNTCGNRLCVNPEHLELFDPQGWKKQYAI